MKPTLYIPAQERGILLAFARQAKGEVSGRALLRVTEDGAFAMFDVQIGEQVSSAAGTLLTSRGEAGLIAHYGAENTDGLVWWHTHPFGTKKTSWRFWSGSDEATIERYLKQRQYQVSVLTNGYDIIARLDVAHPVRVRKDLRVEVFSNIEVAEEAWVREELDAKWKQKEEKKDGLPTTAGHLRPTGGWSNAGDGDWSGWDWERYNPTLGEDGDAEYLSLGPGYGDAT